MHEKLIITVNEFIHVGVALVILLAVVSVLAGLVRAYLPQEKFGDKLGGKNKLGPVIGAVLGILTPF
ncbi:MAG: hypothetical protein AAGU23_00285 [Bacillota bacterium]